MDKRRAIQIMANAAKLYRDNFEDQKLMFLYGIPAEVKYSIWEKTDTEINLRDYCLAECIEARIARKR